MSGDTSSAGLTALIKNAQDGDREAESELLTLLDGKLRELARRILADGSQSLSAADLVHAAWLRVFHGGAQPDIASRNAFMAYISRAMRNLLIDYVRKRARQPQSERIAELDALAAEFEAGDRLALLDLDNALQVLQEENERQFLTVERRFFGGLTMQQIADLHQVSLTTAENDWRLARAKLRRLLGKHSQDDAPGI